MVNFTEEIVELNENKVIEILKEKLANNEEIMAIMDEIKVAMKEIVRRFEYFNKKNLEGFLICIQIH